MSLDLDSIDIGSAELLYTMSDEPPADMEFNDTVGAPPPEARQTVTNNRNMTTKLNMNGFTR